MVDHSKLLYTIMVLNDSKHINYKLLVQAHIIIHVQLYFLENLHNFLPMILKIEKIRKIIDYNFILIKIIRKMW